MADPKKKSAYSVKKWANRQKVPGRLKSILSALADYANGEGMSWPSQRALADRTGYCVRSVRAGLSELERFGVIKRQKRSKGNGGRTSDLIFLSIEREFKITLYDVRKNRSQAANCAGNQKSPNRQTVPPQAANCAGDRTTTELPDIPLASRVTDLEEGIPVISEGGVLVTIPAGRVLH